MSQVKKEAVRTRILEAASRLFEEKGYVGSTMSQIAARAKISSANIYVYFPSKLDIAFQIFEPWIVERIEQVEVEARDIRDPRERLAYMFARLWRDIPYERNNYFNNFIQAIAVSTRGDGYTPAIRNRMRERIASMVLGCMSEERRERFDADSFAHMVVMAFDGFVINGHLDPQSSCTDAVIDALCTLILGDAQSSASGGRSGGRSRDRRSNAPTR